MTVLIRRATSEFYLPNFALRNKCGVAKEPFFALVSAQPRIL
jgi:hypothetical protein